MHKCITFTAAIFNSLAELLLDNTAIIATEKWLGLSISHDNLNVRVSGRLGLSICHPELIALDDSFVKNVVKLGCNLSGGDDAKAAVAGGGGGGAG